MKRSVGRSLSIAPRHIAQIRNSLALDGKQRACMRDGSIALHPRLIAFRGMKIPQKIIDRFFAKTRVDHGLQFDGTPCLIWTGATGTKNGNGRFHAGDRHWVASQFAYVLQHGQIPDGLRIWKNCGTQLCVNHLHLEAITEAEAGRRGRLRIRPESVFRCCGREKTPENTYGGPDTGYQRRCKVCQKKSQKRWVAKPEVRRRIRAQQRARRDRLKAAAE